MLGNHWRCYDRIATLYQRIFKEFGDSLKPSPRHNYNITNNDIEMTLLDYNLSLVAKRWNNKCSGLRLKYQFHERSSLV